MASRVSFHRRRRPIPSLNAPDPAPPTNDARSFKRQDRRDALLTTLLVFTVLTSLRVLSAFVSPIADCDETFNYWEPMHYLLHHFGFQTWEYSPAFTLRSYAFLYPSAAIASFIHFVSRNLIRFLPIATSLPSPKIFSFYAVRILQAVCCALAETLFCSAVRTVFGHRVATLLACFLATSAGMFRASSEFLPSSFAMIALTLAFTAWMHAQYFRAVFLVALSSLMGWVFAAVLGLPLAVHLIITRRDLPSFLRYAVLSAVTIGIVMVPIDSLHFGRPAFAPLQHILYNVFPKEGTGSHLFGVEPWTFYVQNLVLNFGPQALLFLIYPFLLPVLCFAFRSWRSDVHAIWDRYRYLSAPYIALAIFLSQPHKEERFLAPCYPLISLCAAVALADVLSSISHVLFDDAVPVVPEKGRRPRRTHAFAYVIMLIALALAFVFGFSRAALIVRGYSAPIKIYSRLNARLIEGKGLPSGDINICVGKEWYRFPTSFFLPNRRFRLRFIRAGFTGLLPKPFVEGPQGTRIIPGGMNEFNKEDPEQYYDWANQVGCHFFVDLDLSHRNEDNGVGEKQNPIRPEFRRVIISERFLDTEKSPGGLRTFYVPGFESRLVYGEYQVVQNTELVVDSS